MSVGSVTWKSEGDPVTDIRTAINLMNQRVAEEMTRPSLPVTVPYPIAVACLLGRRVCARVPFWLVTRTDELAAERLGLLRDLPLSLEKRV